MDLIVAVDSRWGIGRDSGLLASVPGDMKFFRETTTGGVVVMGRKTLESMPGGKPLPKRVNIVITRQPDYEAPGAVVVHGREELSEALKKCGGKKVFIIGGGSVYREFYKDCRRCYVTKLQDDLNADTFIVDLDEDPDFTLVYESPAHEENGIRYTFCTYEKAEK